MGKRLEALKNQADKRFGPNAIRKASTLPPIVTIPSGVLGLDLNTSGGIPLSRMSIFRGPYGGAKTTVALKVVASAQYTDRSTYEPLTRGDQDKKGNYAFLRPDGTVGEPMTVAFVDAEGAFVPEWAEKLGVDTERLEMVPSPDQESVWDMVLALIETTEIDLIVVDSVAALAPADELKASLMDQRPGALQISPRSTLFM